MNRIFISFIFLMMTLLSVAQSEVSMADKFRADGKIYVVVAVILVTLFGMFISLIRIDRRISKLEKEKRQKE